jgi:hypothetical protein
MSVVRVVGIPSSMGVSAAFVGRGGVIGWRFSAYRRAVTPDRWRTGGIVFARSFIRVV